MFAAEEVEAYSACSSPDFQCSNSSDECLDSDLVCNEECDCTDCSDEKDCCKSLLLHYCLMLAFAKSNY